LVTSSEEIEQQIERTRESLSANVDRLGEKVSPKRVVERRVDGVRTSVRNMTEKVMGMSDSAVQNVEGTMQSAASSVSSAASSAGSTVTDMASNVGEAAAQAPQQLRNQAQGNPLAAGVIAFGVGWLISSMLPATERERQLAQQAEAKASDLAQPVAEAAQQVAGNLREPAQEAVEQIKNAASDGAAQTADQARSAADDVRAPITQ
jgi:uncharacterized phage infection (PIP) family protein YhgE